MMNETFAQHFSAEWIQAWNDHDLDRVMSHYADELTFVSPFIVQLNNDPTGTISSKKELRDYFSRALQRFPDLRFELYKALTSVNSVVLYYRSVNDLNAAEYMSFDSNGKVNSVVAHYAP